MRMKVITIILIVIVLCFTTSCTKPQNEMEVYSFSGEDENISIDNGLIIATNDTEKFIGGDLSFKYEMPYGVKNYFKEFYFYKGRTKEVILNGSTETKGSTEGLPISSNLGSISGEDIFSNNDIELIQESLKFYIGGNLMNGDGFKYDLVLDVEKVY